MPHYKYLQLALRGEVEGATRTIYSYSGSAEGEAVDPAWATTMVEPSAAIRRFLNADECYVMQQSPKGHYISLIARRSDVTDHKSYYMISLLVDNGCALTGRQVLSLMNAVRKAWIEQDNPCDESTETALLECEVPVEPKRLEAWTYAAPSSGSPREEAAYRTYMSVQELESIFSFPGQPDYEDYRCVLIVSATTSLRPGVKMPRITVPIRKQYDVICPEGASASATLLYDGDRLTITYSKEGFDSHSETVVAGNPSAYIKYEGSTMNVRPASKTGIRFVRRVPVKVTSSKGGAINGYTISVNSRTVSTIEPYLELTERDLTPGSKVEIQAVSNNYSPIKLSMTAEEMLKLEDLTLELQPVEQTVSLRLDFGDDRVMEQEITIEKSSPEYIRLHSGNFHGFRAHRQVNDAGGEVYNVDVRAGSLPEAPNFASSRGENVDTRMKAPQFVNVSDDASDSSDRPEIDTTLPEKEHYAHGGNAGDSAEVEAYDDESSRRRRKSQLRWWVIAAAVIAAVVIAAIFLPRGTSLDMPPAADTEMTSATDPGTTAPTPMTPEEQADADYLNGSATWDLNRLTSPMGQALAEAMRSGNLEALANNDYFAVNGRCTNSQANQIADMAWRAIGSPSEKGNSQRLRRAANATGDISLHELINSMAKARPSERPNDRPRPRR